MDVILSSKALQDCRSLISPSVDISIMLNETPIFPLTHRLLAHNCFACVGLRVPLRVRSLSQRMLCAFCTVIIHSALAICTATGKMPLRPSHHKPLQPPRSLREMKCPKFKQRQHRLPGTAREGGERRLDSRKGPSCQITARTQTRGTNCNSKVG